MNKSKALYAVGGFPGTGKSTIAEYFRDTYGFHIFEGSSAIREEAAQRGVTLRERVDYEAFHVSLQEELGATWLTDRAMSLGHDRIVQSGLRLKSNYYRIKEVGGIVMGLVCPPEICVARADKADPKTPKTVEEYVAHMAVETSEHENGSQTAWIIEHADYILDTSKPQDDTLAEVDEIIAIHTPHVTV